MFLITSIICSLKLQPKKEAINPFEFKKKTLRCRKKCFYACITKVIFFLDEAIEKKLMQPFLYEIHMTRHDT